MEKEIIFSQQEISTADLNGLQGYKETAIKNRFTDINQPGIVNINAVSPYVGQFSINVNGGDATKFDIAYGVSYNSDGERYGIISGELVNYDPTPFTNSALRTDGQIPPEPTPYSSGNVAIPTTLNDTTYVFIDYLETVEIASTDSAYPYGNWNIPSVLKYAINQETGRTKYPYRKNGYLIRTGLAAAINPGTAPFTPVLTAFPKAIYLGKVVNALGVLTITYNDATHVRQYYAEAPYDVAIETPASQASTEITQIYTSGANYTVNDHIRAVSNYSLIKPNNPHGQTIYDLGYTGSDLSGHRKEQHSPMVFLGTTPIASTSSLFYPALTTGTQLVIQGLAAGEAAFSAGARMDIVSNPPLGSATTFNFTAQPVGIYYFYLDGSGNMLYTTILSTVTSNNYLLICTVEWALVSAVLTFRVPNDTTYDHLGLVDNRDFGSISIKDISLGVEGQGNSFGGIVGQIGEFLALPLGWLECNGVLISYNMGNTLAVEKNLLYYNLVNYLIGLGSPFAGPDPTSAYLPSIQGKFVIGQDGVSFIIGTPGGAATHYHSVSQKMSSGVQSAGHTHTLGTYSNPGWLISGTHVGWTASSSSDVEVLSATGSGTGYLMVPTTTGQSDDHSHAISSVEVNTGSPLPVSANLPPYYPLMKCIKY